MDLSKILNIVLCNYLIHIILYYSSSAILFIVDSYQYFKNHKIQKDYRLMMSYYQKCFGCVLINTLIYSLIPITLLAWYESQSDNQFHLYKFFFDIIMTLFFTDFFFYSIHSLMHWSWIYQYFHKKHHQIIAPIGFSAVYMTPTDFLIGNCLPAFLPLYLLGAHGLTIKIWIALTTLNTILISHSGFNNLSDFHDIHHSHFNRNFGINLYMDWLCGTLKK